MRSRFLAPAAAEADEAAAYFDGQRDGLGDRFEEDLRETVAFLAAHPSSGKPVTERVRTFSLRRFRYRLVYVIDRDEIVIVAVAHHRRRPNYWRARL